MNKKVLRSLYGPSLTEVVLGAVLSLAVGVVLAALFLTFKPVTVANELPAPDKQIDGMVYYVQGTKDADKGRQLLRKQQLFVEGSSITLTEDELNTWMAASSSAPKKPAADAKPGADAPPAVAANELNFRIHNGELQIGLPYTVDLLGLSGSVILQMQGTFVKQGDVFVYVPDKFFIGSLPALRIPLLSAFLMKKIYSTQELPDDLSAAWKKLTGVTIAGNTLQLTMPK
ncbi:MAG TPA: hypothetical protein VNW23_05535 [Opitutaceae bacterium]|jgi:hypothetical protein|nr:hypothetical protein [Opitutaceae bacterium]